MQLFARSAACRTAFWLLTLCVTGMASAANRADAVQTGKWRVATPEHALEGVSGIRETVWEQPRAPGGSFDRIGLHRYRGKGRSLAAVLYLPGTNMNGVVANRDEVHNLWLYLAARGIEVFALDYRSHAIAPETPADSLAALRQWDTATFVGDIESAAVWARTHAGKNPLFVAGFSRGGYLAYAHALAYPQGLAGLVILDAGFKNNAPRGQYDAAAALAKLQATDRWASDVSGSQGWAARQQLMRTVADDPAAKSPSSKYATAGELLTHVLQTTWGNGGLANPEGGASKPQVLATLLLGYDRYYPAIQDVEGMSVADHADDPATSIDDGWGSLRLPVIAFSSTGFGADWVAGVTASAKGSGSADANVHVLEGYGHLDVLVGEQARDAVYRPTLEWIMARLAAGANATPP